MIISNPKRPITLETIDRYGDRLDASTFLSGGVEARLVLKGANARTVPLKTLTVGGEDGIYHAGRFSRTWVLDPEFGVPFMGTSAILQSDLTDLPLISREQVEENGKMTVEENMTLVTRSGTIGRTAYARPNMLGLATSEDVLKVSPDPDAIPPGYLYAYLTGSIGNTIVTSNTYGAIIQHVEPSHLADLPVPRLGDLVEGEAHRLVQTAADLRARYQALLTEATDRLFASVGLRDIAAHEWHEQGPDLGFSAPLADLVTLRALNYNPRAERILADLRNAPHKTLGEICAGGQLGSGPRFKRVDADPSHESAVKLIGQKHAFWLHPEGRWISQLYTPDGVMMPDETVMFAAHGTLGEKEVYGRSIFVTGSWTEYAYTQDLYRVISGDPEVPGPYLFAFMRSEIAFRLIRSCSTGSKQQDIQPDLIAALPVPLAPEPERAAIAELVRTAYRGRDEADRAEADAIALVERTIAE